MPMTHGLHPCPWHTFDPVEAAFHSLVLVIDRPLHPFRSLHHHRDGDFCLPRHAKSFIDGDILLQLLQLGCLFVDPLR